MQNMGTSRSHFSHRLPFTPAFVVAKAETAKVAEIQEKGQELEQIRKMRMVCIMTSAIVSHGLYIVVGSGYRVEE